MATAQPLDAQAKPSPAAKPAPALKPTPALERIDAVKYRPTVPITPAPPAAPTTPAADAEPATRVAMLTTTLHSDRTNLVFQSVGSKTAAAPVATLTHLPDSRVRGAVIPESERVVAVAAVNQQRDRSWSAALFLLEAGRPPKQLIDKVYDGSRPIVSGRKVYVVIGSAAAPAATSADADEAELRVDELHLTEVDTQIAVARRIKSLRGHFVHIIGVFDGELIVYYIGPDGAHLRAYAIADGKERTLAASIPPHARAFSIDVQQRALLYTNRDAQRQWRVEQLDLTKPSAPRRTLKVAPHVHLIATPWPKKGVGISEGPLGLTVKSGASARRLTERLGPGSDEVRDFYEVKQTAWAVGVHSRKGAFPVPFAVTAEGERLIEIPTPENTHVDVVGVLPTQAAVRLPIREQLAPTRLKPPVKVSPQQEIR